MDRALRLLFVGDVVGTLGCEAAHELIPALRGEMGLDAVIVNGENSAPNGFGLTERTAALLLAVADFVTLGDHAFDQPDTGPLLEREPRIIRPANWEGEWPGRGWGIFEAAGMRIGVVNLLGKVFMRPPVTSRHAAVERAIAELHDAGAGPIVVDIQAEATSEKQGMGWYLAGRVAAVLGTHTHVPTADLRLLPGGTAYVSDVGMTGARDAILGFDKDAILSAARTGTPLTAPPRPAEHGPARLDAVLLEIDPASGRTVRAERVYRER